jgi:DNA-binding response OmpR family regulator
MAQSYGPEEVVTVLAVGRCEETRNSLKEIIGRSRWRLIEAESLQEARAVLALGPVPIVLCDCCLPDGDWQRLLAELEKLSDPPLLVVASRNADDSLWAEVLNLGGYDVLDVPFDRREVVRVLGVAWLHWREGRSRIPVTSASSITAVAAGA